MKGSVGRPQPNGHLIMQSGYIHTVPSPPQLQQSFAHHASGQGGPLYSGAVQIAQPNPRHPGGQWAAPSDWSRKLTCFQQVITSIKTLEPYPHKLKLSMAVQQHNSSGPTHLGRPRNTCSHGFRPPLRQTHRRRVMAQHLLTIQTSTGQCQVGSILQWVHRRIMEASPIRQCGE